jgi:hypothetical protein
MKRTNFFLILVTMVSTLVIISSCKKDSEETKNPYYGKWQSRAFNSPTDPTTFEKMVFDFTNTTFEDKVFQGASADALQQAAGIKGTIDYTAPSTIDVTVTEVSVGGSPYVDKSVDATTFETFFALSVGTLLDEQFTATFAVVGDSLELTLPVKISPDPITIKLGKVE